MSEKLQVWSCGGGTQSCAIAALIVQGKLPKPDYSVIADTGYETGATWEFMDRILVPKLAEVGVNLVRISAQEFGYYGNKIKTDTSPGPLIPAYSTYGIPEGNRPIKLKNFCTRNWKIDVIKKWLSTKHGVTASKRRQWLGFSRDEQRRWVAAMAHKDFQKGLTFLPLVTLGLTRRDCISLVEKMGWGTPPRSACWMCPNHSDVEWLRLQQERPDEFAKAVAIEKEIQATDPSSWLHRSCVPLDQVDFSQPEDLFSRPCDSGQCFV